LEEALASLEAEKPVIILDTVPIFEDGDWEEFHPQRVLDFFAANYDYVGRVYFADVYRLREPGARGPAASY
jgi:hypothetical protein